MSVRAPYLPYDELRRMASEFLAAHNLSNEIPVSIERIVEFDFGIDIVPTPGLHDNFDIDSYPTSDLLEIHIDDFVYRQRPTRYRFSLAHELSHLLIHSEIFSQLRFSSIAEWRSAVQSIPEDQYSWIEWQAYSLAGLILVPSEALCAEFESVVKRAAEAGITIEEASAGAKQLLEAHIAKAFDVSREVVSRRIKLDKLWPND